MHFQQDGLHDTLDYNLQVRVAEGLGYGPRAEMRSVEVFMRDYYLHARTIFSLNRRLSHEFREVIEPVHQVTRTAHRIGSQFYLHDGVLDPFGSLSRLKQHVIGKVTREDHGQIMNTTIRFYAGARDAEQKQAMAFDLSEFDHKLLRFGRLFRRRFMDIEVALPLEEALDLCWKTLAECFEPGELLMRQHLIDKYYPRNAAGRDDVAAA